MEIRPVQLADAGAVNELLAVLGYPQGEPQDTARRINAWSDDPSGVVYVAEEAGVVAGVIAVQLCPFFEREGSWGRITALVVSERARRRGVASQLMAAGESFARERGCVRMEVTSRQERSDAHEFYRRYGYDDQTGKSSRFLRDLSLVERRDG
ncbi:ribosomal protein S18 acetylase RimI-like enzyme [Kribbella voronezhensis]|uniref:Ribosomal protein S18 acetylase RimI-like enzyme n=1 Tax=Kribbella voronezhensis TaxID=2512212 RepID=A0A4R7T7W1_9ACTN|nr:GNAT family N-acetyltransferase [Kribbella voronezhensis]TDU88022.1 ribosomal protein S18 acetylase RimI-like enzyme [Kribbella voronezhensis]